MARKLRIAVSIFSAMLTIATTVLWVWSYWGREGVSITSRPRGYNSDMNGIFYAWSSHGEFGLSGYWTTGYRLRGPYRWEGRTKWQAESLARTPEKGFARMGFRWSYEVDNSSPEQWGVTAPHWFIASIFLMTAIIAWPRKHCLRSIRFSLRTMLAAMTLIAILIGMVVWTTF